MCEWISGRRDQSGWFPENFYNKTPQGLIKSRCRQAVVERWAALNASLLRHYLKIKEISIANRRVLKAALWGMKYCKMDLLLFWHKEAKGQQHGCSHLLPLCNISLGMSHDKHMLIRLMEKSVRFSLKTSVFAGFLIHEISIHHDASETLTFFIHNQLLFGHTRWDKHAVID